MKLKKRINPEIQRKLDDAYFVGRLANEDELSLTPIFNEAVEYQGEMQDYIQFHIKCLSPIPNDLSKQFYYSNRIFTGSTVSNNNYNKFREWIRIDRLPHFEIKEKIFEYLNDKLIIFQMSCSNEYVNIEIIKVEDIKPADRGYMIIPGPQMRLDETKQDFEKKLSGLRRPFVLKNYPNIFELPEFIYNEGAIYEVSLRTNLNATTYSQEDASEVFYLDHIEDVFIDMVDARIDDHLYFVQVDKLPDFRDLFDEKKQSLSLKINMVEATKEKEAVHTQAAAAEVIEESRSVIPAGAFNKGEWEFLKRLKDNAKKKGLFFHDDDLYAFHISVKTNLLSIIGGMSGTGKSQLAQLYGETMGLAYGSEMLLIPVSPSYHEPNDILGYLNPTTGVYHESETSLVRMLLEAEETPEKMYMVIFDEMNLSQVEHWFSPFISLLEVDPDKRFLTLFNENSYCVNNKYKNKVKIGDNIIFVGTVNFDDTTKDFSDRLLDRTNVIRPTKLSFKESLKIATTFVDKTDIDSLNVPAQVFRKEWMANEKTTLSVLSEPEIEFLDRLHNLLNEDDSQKGVSFRVALGMARFLANIPVNPDGTLVIPREKAFDRQIEQRILTKIKGFESYVKPLVGNYSNDQYIEGEIMALIQSDLGQKVSQFERSILTLKRKAKELMLYGFAN